MPAAERVYNFSSGPAVLPLPVLEQVQRDLVALPGVGMSVMEISHRSSTFEAIIGQAEADIRRLAGVPGRLPDPVPAGRREPPVLDGADEPPHRGDHRRLHQHRLVGREGGQGGQAGRERARDRPARGSPVRPDPDRCRVRVHARRRLRPHDLEQHDRGDPVAPAAASGDAPLVNDASSDIFSGPVDVSRYGLIYAGAQKNLGPSGVVLVIIREDLLARSTKSLHTMLNYAVQAENGSLYNTPPAFGVYVLGLVMQWLLAQGGLPAIAAVNERKAGKLYDELDRTGFWRPDGPGRQPQPDERHVPDGDRGPRGAFIKESHRGRLRRPQGPSVRRRHARLDLQRVPGGRRGRVDRVHARLRTTQRLAAAAPVSEGRGRRRRSRRSSPPCSPGAGCGSDGPCPRRRRGVPREVRAARPRCSWSQSSSSSAPGQSAGHDTLPAWRSVAATTRIGSRLGDGSAAATSSPLARKSMKARSCRGTWRPRSPTDPASEAPPGPRRTPASPCPSGRGRRPPPGIGWRTGGRYSRRTSGR